MDMQTIFLVIGWFKDIVVIKFCLIIIKMFMYLLFDQLHLITITMII